MLTGGAPGEVVRGPRVIALHQLCRAARCRGVASCREPLPWLLWPRSPHYLVFLDHVLMHFWPLGILCHLR